MLQENKTLKVMNLSLSFMSDEALLALGEGLKKNSGLEYLNIIMPGEGAGVGVCQQFVLYLKENRHLTVHNPSTVRREIEAVNDKMTAWPSTAGGLVMTFLIFSSH